MKFTILSHAGLAVEHRGVRVVCDPWLIGSCYWRSWWNFPEPDPELVRGLAPQFIYLTHLHWDHFHGPSLKKLFDPKTTILVPKVPTRRMIDDLHWLGFENIREIPHGQKVPLGEDFELTSYQFGVGVDSGAVISGGGHTLFNCNDCKFFGLPLRQIMRDYPRIDFILRSHSSASPVPLCIEGHEKLLPPGDGSHDSAEQFARCTVYTGARYAIPFASNHCFLHPETIHFNSAATTPDLARSRYVAVARESGVGTECVVMPPASSWSDDEGFDIAAFDFSRRQEYVEDMLRRNAATLAAQAEFEARTLADFPAFEAYMRDFFASIPWPMRGWYLAPMIFKVNASAGPHLWLADPRRALISIVHSIPADTVIFEVHGSVLNDCAKLKMFSVWTASKRVRIHLPSAAALSRANRWFTFLDLYETDSLPIAKNFTWRALSVRLRRWREPVEVANILFRRVFLRQRFSVSRVYAAAGRKTAPVG
jgi:UDP-MurNAc hydroxylase